MIGALREEAPPGLAMTEMLMALWWQQKQSHGAKQPLQEGGGGFRKSETFTLYALEPRRPLFMAAWRNDHLG